MKNFLEHDVRPIIEIQTVGVCAMHLGGYEYGRWNYIIDACRTEWYHRSRSSKSYCRRYIRTTIIDDDHNTREDDKQRYLYQDDVKTIDVV